MGIEQTMVMIKPDGVRRRLVGKIIQHIEDASLQIVNLKMMDISRELAEIHYIEHKGKPFYEALIDFITSGPVVVMVVEGDHAVSRISNLIGSTSPMDAQPGTIRFMYAASKSENIIHRSDSPESAMREINLFFKR
ncbi:MAG: nucleoside-diphosphate kinase [Bacillota bacterium]